MSGPLTLAIEASNPAVGAGVAIGDGAVLGAEPLAPTGRHDDDLMPAIDRLCRRVGAAPGDLGRVAVSIGPGGYTGLRVAVAAAKMICEATGAGCVPVATAVVASLRVEAAGPFAVALASKRESAHVTIFEAPGRPRDRGRLATADDLADLEVSTLVADGHLPGAMRSRAGELGIPIVALVLDPAACFEASLELDAVDPVSVEPLYPRPPEAVVKWRGKR